ncbi:uncharacterized protein BKA55DRAFT_117010 [Fusarium redolens]|uniref:Uncharacterized protein n=1 Tax=Fusarium redolens TaxID=48865 RepID=A0A9P9GLQ0_FUSRE|nr:uncharacterized protein BKA55DRAFT_117010 [Fusarium redolens]KAH7240172.1 hypothetical protein BKA55DRAFT_117010 [Fusarium redolens]
MRCSYSLYRRRAMIVSKTQEQLRHGRYSSCRPSVFKAPLLSIPLPDKDEYYGDFRLHYSSGKGPVSLNYGNTFNRSPNSESSSTTLPLCSSPISRLLRTPPWTESRDSAFDLAASLDSSGMADLESRRSTLVLVPKVSRIRARTVVWLDWCFVY